MAPPAKPAKGAKRKRGSAKSVSTHPGVSSPVRTGRVGRPSRLSREMIIDASLALLAENSVDEFTLAHVAKRLDTVSMALYNYFPSREALLAEIANHIGKQFRMPEPRPGQDWKARLRDWLWTLRELGGRYPVLFRIAGVEGRTSAGWLHIVHVPGVILRDLGLRGRDLALTYWLLCMKAHALVQAEVTQSGFRAPVSLSRLEELEPEEQVFFRELRPSQASISGDDILEAGLAELITIIETRLPAKAVSRSRRA